MPRKTKKESQIKDVKEPSFIIRPASKRAGLDYLHISLIALVVILVLLAFALAAFKQGAVVQNCVGSIINGTCAAPHYNQSQVLDQAQRVLATYSTFPTGLQLLAYYSDIGRATASYIPNQSEWLVVVPYTDPLANNASYNFSMVFYDSNLTLSQAYLSSIKPSSISQNRVVSQGVVSLAARSKCTSSKPIPLYSFVDPYSVGAFQSIYRTINMSKQYSGSLNVSYKFIFTGAAALYYNGYGVTKTQDLGRYLFCASLQPRFPQYFYNVSNMFTGAPVSNITLQALATSTRLNLSQFNGCIANSSQTLEAQAFQANLYNITTTPTYVLNCKYMVIPQTLQEGINYSLSTV